MRACRRAGYPSQRQLPKYRNMTVLHVMARGPKHADAVPNLFKTSLSRRGCDLRLFWESFNSGRWSRARGIPLRPCLSPHRAIRAPSSRAPISQAADVLLCRIPGLYLFGLYSDPTSLLDFNYAALVAH